MLLLPTVSLALPASFDNFPASQPRSLSTSPLYSSSGDVAALQNVERSATELLYDSDSRVLTKRQSLLPISSLSLNSLTPNAFNLTEAPPGEFDGTDIDQTISFDVKIPLPVWSAVYFRV